MSQEVRNLGNAAVIIACVYFLINSELGFWAKAGIFLILIFSIGTWGLWTYPHKDLDAQIKEATVREIDARTRNINSITALNTSSAFLTREKALWYKKNNQH